MSGQDWIALVLAGGSLLFALRWIYKSLRAESGCGCSSGKSCGSSSINPESETRPIVKPLVSLGTPPKDSSSGESSR